jgi:hypothetical protein
MNTWRRDLGLPRRLEYFNMVAHTPTWDLGSPTYIIIMVHTYLWDPGIWLYTLITHVEDNDFIRGMGCSVARGNNVGYLRRYPRGITIYKYCYV